MSIEIVLVKRDRFGRKTEGKTRFLTSEGSEAARHFEKVATKGVRKERKDIAREELYKVESDDED